MSAYHMIAFEKTVTGIIAQLTCHTLRLPMAAALITQGPSQYRPPCGLLLGEGQPHAS